MRWLTILFSAQSHHSHVLCFLVGGSANGKREKRRRRRKRWRERREGEVIQLNPHTHTCMYLHTCIHTHIHTYIHIHHACTYTDVCINKKERMKNVISRSIHQIYY